MTHAAIKATAAQSPCVMLANIGMAIDFLSRCCSRGFIPDNAILPQTA